MSVDLIGEKNQVILEFKIFLRFYLSHFACLFQFLLILLLPLNIIPVNALGAASFVHESYMSSLYLIVPEDAHPISG